MPTPNFEEVENKVHQYLLWDNWAGLFEYLEKALHQVSTESYNQGVEDSIEALEPPERGCEYMLKGCVGCMLCTKARTQQAYVLETVVRLNKLLNK